MKKGLTILLVLSLVLSLLTPVAVGATGGLPEDVTVRGTAGITVKGTPAPVLSGVLPTNAGLDFIIDPLGLANVTVGGVVNPGNPNVTFRHSTGVLSFANRSSVPVLATATLSVTEDGFGANFVLTMGDVADGAGYFTEGNTDANILMWTEVNETVQHAIPSAFNSAGFAIPFGENPVPLHFRLQERAHNPVITGPASDGIVPVALQPATGAAAQYGTSIQLAGIVNTNADSDAWGDVGDITITAVFTMVQAAPNVLDAPFLFTDGDTLSAYGLLGSYGPNFEPARIAIPDGAESSNVPRTLTIVGTTITTTRADLGIAGGTAITITSSRTSAPWDGWRIHRAASGTDRQWDAGTGANDAVWIVLGTTSIRYLNINGEYFTIAGR